MLEALCDQDKPNPERGNPTLWVMRHLVVFTKLIQLSCLDSLSKTVAGQSWSFDHLFSYSSV